MDATTVVLGSAPDHIERAAAALRDGAVVAMPTETVYGLAADATNVTAVAGVFHAKQRPADDPLIVHVSPDLLRPHGSIVEGLTALGILSSSAPAALLDHLRELGRRHWPGPLTLIVPKGPAIPASVTSGLPSVAVRMPEHPTAQALITAAGRPLVAPSANRFGRISPTRASDVVKELGGRIPYVVDGGPCRIGVESTVLRLLEGGTTQLLRPGAISAAQVMAATGAMPEPPPPRQQGPQVAPGQLASHYAPTAPVVLAPPHDAWSAAWWRALRTRLTPGQTLAWLAWRGEAQDVRLAVGEQPEIRLVVEVLSPRDDVTEAASRLFSSLRSLDGHHPDLIVVERCPHEHGLGAAIRDRMQRAAASTPPLDPDGA